MSFLQINSSEKASIQVAVRIRPPNKRENDTDVITSTANNNVYLKNPEDKKKKTFGFDFTYDLNSTQDDVFADVGNKVVENVFKGYNTCVFAYGQTGTGKSYVMMGNDQNVGLIPRICQTLFDKQENHNGINVGNATVTYKIELSYLEIYSEEVYDLLSKTGKQLKVREHPILGPYVDSLSQILVDDYKNIKKFIDQGNKERATASTLMNNKSSRSHAILTLYFTQLIDEPELGKTREIVSKINLVDLAGSERVEISGVTGINFKEAININKSLSVLGNVINKLATESVKQDVKTTVKKVTKLKKTKSVKKLADHIPFRESVLTWILKESLGGNSRTYMIATISPSSINYNESLNTLRYAYNAKQIINTIKINEDPNDKLIRVLKDELATLRSQLATKGSDSTSTNEELQKLREEISNREQLMKEKDKTWEQKLEERDRRLADIEIQYKYQINSLAAKMREMELNKSSDMSQSNELLLRKQTDLEKNQINIQEIYEKKLEKLQADLQAKLAEKDNTSIQEMYENKLKQLQAEFSAKLAEKDSESKQQSIAELTELKEINHKLKDELNKNQMHLQQQMKQFTTDRVMLSKQIQQLHTKIHSLEQDLQNKSSIDVNNLPTELQTVLTEYNKTKELREIEEQRLNVLQSDCSDLTQRIEINKTQLVQIESKHTELINNVEIKTAELDQLKLDYANLADKFAADKVEYELLLTKKDALHASIDNLKQDLDNQVAEAKEKLKNPTIEDLLKIKDGLAKIFDNINK